MTAIAVAILCCRTHDARAEVDRSREPGLTLAVAPSLGVLGVTDAPDLAAVGRLALDVSWRTSHVPWWVRGEAAFGRLGGPDSGAGKGRVYELRAGLEHRPPACGRACFYYGVDLALARDDWRDGSYQLQLTSVLAVPRGGIDLGSDRVRFRIGLELPLGVSREHEQDPTMSLDSTRNPPTYGLALTTALAIHVD